MKVLTIVGEEAGNIRDILNQSGAYKHNIGLINSLQLQIVDDNDSFHNFSLENTTVHVEHPSCHGFGHGERVTDHNEALVEAYGRFSPVMEYLLVLDEDPREGRVVTTRVRELWAAQDEKGPKGLFAGALSTTTTVGRLKYVLFAVPEGLEHHSLLEVVDEGDTLGPVLATIVWELHDALVNAWPPSGVSYREVRVVRAYRAAMAALAGYERYPRDCEPATVGFPHYVGERVTPAL